jgi:hypothetical protein
VTCSGAIVRGRSAPVLALLLSLAAPFPGQAQRTGSYFCLRGAPPPGCRGFLRLEVRGGGSVSEATRVHYSGKLEPSGEFVPTGSEPWLEVGDWIGVEVGYALNVGDAWAVGATGAVETGNETTRHMLRARIRHWLTTRVYAEVLPGLFRQRRDVWYRSGDGLATHNGVSVEGRLGLSDILFGSVRYDVLHIDAIRWDLEPFPTTFDPGGTAHALSIGGGIEGRTAIISTAAAALIGLGFALFVGFPAA